MTLSLEGEREGRPQLSLEDEIANSIYMWVEHANVKHLSNIRNIFARLLWMSAGRLHFYFTILVRTNIQFIQRVIKIRNSYPEIYRSTDRRVAIRVDSKQVLITLENTQVESLVLCMELPCIYPLIRRLIIIIPVHAYFSLSILHSFA